MAVYNQSRSNIIRIIILMAFVVIGSLMIIMRAQRSDSSTSSKRPTFEPEPQTQRQVLDPEFVRTHWAEIQAMMKVGGAGMKNALIEADNTFREFFDAATINPKAIEITGVICGVRIEEIEDPLMKKIRYLDKLVDEVAKGRAMEKILRS